MEKPNEINYICARWRDAENDPPPEKACECKTYTIKAADGDMFIYTRCGCHGNPTWLGRHRTRDIQPGDQWLDVTDTPAIPRAKVQAAVDEIHAKAHYWMGEGAREAPFHEVGDQYNHMASGLSQAMKIIETSTGVIRATGVTPTEDSK